MLTLLEKLSQSKPERQAGPNQQTEPRPTVRLPENLRQEIERAQGTEAQFKVVQAYFNAAPVRTSQQIRDGCFYSLLQQGEILLLFCKSNVATSDTVGMSLAFTGQDLRPILRKNLLELGKQNRLHQLDLKTLKAATTAQMAVVDGPQPSGETAIRTINELFASLIPIAKASGLPVNINAIVFVREHDYYAQPGRLFRLMSASQQQALFANTARAMGDAPTRFLRSPCLKRRERKTRGQEGCFSWLLMFLDPG